jgi:DNA-directed RNA polymerase specialized sigma24 family protein
VISDEDLNEEVRAILAEHGTALRRYLRGCVRLPADVADEVMNDVLFVVAVLGGFTIAETAEVLGIAQGTVGSTTTAAIKANPRSWDYKHH